MPKRPGPQGQHRPGPDDELRSAQASQILGLSPMMVWKLAREGDLRVHRLTPGGFRIYLRKDVETLRDQRAALVTQREAARLIGVTIKGIRTMEKSGQLPERQRIGGITGFFRKDIDAFVLEQRRKVALGEPPIGTRALEVQVVI